MSAKVRREVWEKARNYGINISEVLRRALEEEVRKRELEELARALEEAGRELSKVSVEEVVGMIREARESR